MKYYIVIVLTAFFVTACKKQTEDIGLLDASNYYPMSVGKVFKYRIDSARLINFTVFDTAYYLIKDSVTGKFVDLKGNITYTVSRYITDTLESYPYQYSETHSIVYDNNKIVYVDGNNFHFIPLVNPLSLNTTTWSGNSILDSTQQIITTNAFYKGWTYQYTSLNQPFTVFDSTYKNTATVLQVDLSSNLSDPNSLYSKEYSVEVYAQKVGLIYKQILVYSHQPPAPDFSKPGYYEDGCFGIKLRLVSYK